MKVGRRTVEYIYLGGRSYIEGNQAVRGRNDDLAAICVLLIPEDGPRRTPLADVRRVERAVPPFALRVSPAGGVPLLGVRSVDVDLSVGRPKLEDALVGNREQQRGLVIRRLGVDHDRRIERGGDDSARQLGIGRLRLDTESACFARGRAKVDGVVKRTGRDVSKCNINGKTWSPIASAQRDVFGLPGVRTVID